jgi:alpha-L-rhamnosidase
MFSVLDPASPPARAPHRHLRPLAAPVAAAWWMIRSLLTTVVLMPPALSGQQGPSAFGLRVEYLTNPLGIDIVRPRFSWRLMSGERNTVQTAYELQVATSEADVARGTNLVWSSGKVTSDASVFVEYAGPALASRTRYWWRVRVWDGRRHASAWSPPAYWEMGLLDPDDWSAQWISPAPSPSDSLPSPSPLLRRAFHVDGAVRSARLYVTRLVRSAPQRPASR